jgi:hypothetical protein
MYQNLIKVKRKKKKASKEYKKRLIYKNYIKNY